ncbi:MAG: MBL fold metallo-hydrolase [Thermoproteota archaeon]
MIIRKFIVGGLQTNCYLLVCPETRQAIVIDPGFTREAELQTIMGEAEKYGADIKYIVNTHWHPDHTSGDGWLKRATGAPVLIHEYDAPMLTDVQGFRVLFGIRHEPVTPDATLTDGSTIVFGKISLRVVHTPGHTRGSISLLNRLTVLTGDTLFAGAVGRTDLPEGSFKELMDSIRTRLMVLPGETKIYPGHGPSSTIARERSINPFLKTMQ